MRALAKKIFKNFSDEIKILTDTFERLYASNASTVAPAPATRTFLSTNLE